MIVKRLNLKNTPQEAAEVIQRVCGAATKTWLPFPGGRVDLGVALDGVCLDPVRDAAETYEETEWDFDTYIDEIQNGAKESWMSTWEGLEAIYVCDQITEPDHGKLILSDSILVLEAYYRWANMVKYDLVLHVVEVTQDVLYYS